MKEVRERNKCRLVGLGEFPDIFSLSGCRRARRPLYTRAVGKGRRAAPLCGLHSIIVSAVLVYVCVCFGGERRQELKYARGRGIWDECCVGEHILRRRRNHVEGEGRFTIPYPHDTCDSRPRRGPLRDSHPDDGLELS